jgi:hypothetical protein
MTTLIAWLGIDQRGPSSLYLASDSRITWGSGDRRWDVGRKLFACKGSADIFGYCGDVLFPSLVLGQITDATNQSLLVGVEDDAETRHKTFLHVMRFSFDQSYNAPNQSFKILHAAREGEGMVATFRIWCMMYCVSTQSWSDEELQLPDRHSALITALGSGASCVEDFNREIERKDTQGRTSRAVFWAFCDALKSNKDPLSGGAPQLAGIYRTQGPKAFGVVYEGRRYFQGLPLDAGIFFDNVEWRDEQFQRVDGASLQLLAGAQVHCRRLPNSR